MNVKAPTNKTLTKRDCGSCYGAETEELSCCNTCEQVREAYRKKGWAFSVLDDISQCSKKASLILLNPKKVRMQY